MVLPGETLDTGAPRSCSECGVTLMSQVMSSAAGWYIGTSCNCGPYSRESGYYKTREAAERDLTGLIYGRP